jgi:hypothetical protein
MPFRQILARQGVHSNGVASGGDDEIKAMHHIHDVMS